MPLLFFLAGAATWFALNHRSSAAYVRERLRRLIVPLIFGTLVIVPPQTFFERLQRGDFSGSYLEFYGHLFNGIYPEGNFTWNHLWFLLYLFLISLSVLPLLSTWKSTSANPLVEKTCTWLVQGRRLFLLFLPLAVVQVALKPAFPGPQNIVSDWARLLFMLICFAYGAAFHAFPGFMESVERNVSSALAAGMAILAIFIGLHLSGYEFIRGYNLPFLLQLAVKSLATLCWLVAWLGIFRRKLDFSNRFLKYANEAALPFYILHQTVIIVLGFHVVKSDLSIAAKFIFINIASFILTLGVYETTIRRLPVSRALFGMRH